MDECSFHLLDFDTQISIGEVKTIASSNLLLNQAQALNTSLNTKFIIYLKREKLHAILHCWKKDCT